MAKRILLLADAFGPPSFGPRIRTLCRELHLQGFEIELYVEQMPHCPPPTFEHNYPLYSIPLYKREGLLGQLEWGVHFLLNLFFDFKSLRFYRKVERLTKQKEYDLVFCCAFHTFPLPTALRLAQRRKRPLVVDIRDLAEQCGGSEYNAHRFSDRIGLYALLSNWHRRNNITRRNRVIQLANAVTTVSPWHQNFLLQQNPNTHLIYNGFDETIFYPRQQRTEKFRITYTGKVYGKRMQDPELLFKGLELLFERHAALREKIEVHLYIGQERERELYQMAKKHQLESLFFFHNYVQNSEVTALLHQSSILLVFSNKTGPTGPFGIMTTKFYEALGVEKPILCVRSDEECLAATIEKTNAGLAATNEEEVAAFILEKYAEWGKGGFTHQAVNGEEKRRFSRQQQALQFMALFQQCIEQDTR